MLKQFSQAVEHLFIYDIESQRLTPLQLPGGSLGWSAYFGPGEEIFAHWEEAAHPTSLIALSSVTGEQTRTVLAAGEVPPGHGWRSIEHQALMLRFAARVLDRAE